VVVAGNRLQLYSDHGQRAVNALTIPLMRARSRTKTPSLAHYICVSSLSLDPKEVKSAFSPQGFQPSLDPAILGHPS
jgi:hypothetical protein